MTRLTLLLALTALVCPGFARAMSGNATLIVYQNTGIAPLNLSTGSTTVLPGVAFSVPDSGSGSYGGSAHAAALELGSSAFVQAVGNNVCKCVGVGAYVLARAVTQDTFDLPGPIGIPAYLVFDLQVGGSAAGTATGNGQFFAGPAGAVRLAARAGIDTSPVTADGLGGATFNPPAALLSSVTPTTTPVRFLVPFAFNSPITVWLALDAVIDAGASDGSVSAVSDYGSTLHVVSVHVEDAQHQPLDVGPIVGGSGTIYPAPEPGAALLAGLGLLLGLTRRVTR